MATPEILSVNGVVSVGETLTITGTNMIDEDRTNWDAFFTTYPGGSQFTGANPAADGYHQPSDPSGGVYDNTVSLIGNQSIKFSVSGTTTSCPDDNMVDYVGMDPVGGNDSERWIRFYARWNLVSGTWPNGYCKCIDGFGPISGNQVYFQINSDGTTPPNSWLTKYDTDSGDAIAVTGGFSYNRWYGIELHWKGTTSGGRRYQVWVDNEQLYDVTPTTEIQLDYIMMGIINTCDGTTNTYGIDNWWDGFGLGTTRVRLASIVEIGDNADYGSANISYQEPLKLGDNESQIKVNFTGLTGSDYWLWVTNNQNERSQAYSLTGSIVPAKATMLFSGKTPTPVGGTSSKTISPGVGLTQFNSRVPTIFLPDVNSLTQEGFRVRNEDFALVSQWLNDQDIQAAIASDTNFFLRVLIDSVGNVGSKKFQLEYKLKTDSAWSPVTDSTAIQLASSQYAVDGEINTALLDPPAGKTTNDFVAGKIWDVSNGKDSISIGNNKYTELEWCLKADSAQTSPLDRYDFRVTSAGGVQRTVFFTEGFEDENFAANRDWYDGDSDASLAAFIDTTVYSPTAGSAAFRIHWDATDTTPLTPKRKLFTPTETLYIAFDMKLGTASVPWQGSGLTYHPHFIEVLTDSNGAFDGISWNYLALYIEPHLFTQWTLLQDGQRIDTGNLGVDLLGTSNTHSIAGGNGNQTQAQVDETDYYEIGGGDYTNAHIWYSPSTNFTNNVWHRIETYVVMNSIGGGVPLADGIMRVWVDGQLAINKTNVYFRTAQYSSQKFNQFLLVPYIGDGSPISQDMWIDNLEVADMPP